LQKIQRYKAPGPLLLA